MHNFYPVITGRKPKTMKSVGSSNLVLIVFFYIGTVHRAARYFTGELSSVCLKCVVAQFNRGRNMMCVALWSSSMLVIKLLEKYPDD